MAFPRGRGRSPGRNLAATATRGAVLIGLAVIIGLVLLQVVDDAKGGGGGSGGGGSAGGVTTTVTTAAGDGSSTSTTVTTVAGGGGRSASQVVVQVLNGSGVAGAASQRSNDLKAKGYQVLPAGNAPAQRTGTAVQCRNGYSKEAATIVNVLGSLSIRATVEAFPNPAPVGVNGQANCLVILGR
jgi:hypothetical protein